MDEHPDNAGIRGNFPTEFSSCIQPDGFRGLRLPARALASYQGHAGQRHCLRQNHRCFPPGGQTAAHSSRSDQRCADHDPLCRNRARDWPQRFLPVCRRR